MTEAVEPRVAAPGAPVPGPVGRLLARVYLAEALRRSRRFDAGRGVVRIDRPVISVGNLSVGGTGKTPMVRWVLRVLAQAGRTPAVAMRGYRSRDGVSDEAELYRGEFPDLPVVARPDRLEGLIAIFATEAGERVDTVVLDDGFQHRRIARDLDLVLVDATRSPFEDDVLPAGRLREPVAALRRAHAVVITHAEAVGERELARLGEQIERVAGRPPIAACGHTWARLALHGPDGCDHHPVAWLRGRTVLPVCGIGNPQAFLAQLAAEGAHLLPPKVYADHAAYPPRRVAALARRTAGAEAIVTTAKDWTKLRDSARDLPVPVVVPELGLTLFRGGDALRERVIEAARGDAA